MSKKRHKSIMYENINMMRRDTKHQTSLNTQIYRFTCMRLLNIIIIFRLANINTILPFVKENQHNKIVYVNMLCKISVNNVCENNFHISSRNVKYIFLCLGVHKLEHQIIIIIIYVCLIENCLTFTYILLFSYFLFFLGKISLAMCYTLYLV